MFLLLLGYLSLSSGKLGISSCSESSSQHPQLRCGVAVDGTEIAGWGSDPEQEKVENGGDGRSWLRSTLLLPYIGSGQLRPRANAEFLGNPPFQASVLEIEFLSPSPYAPSTASSGNFYYVAEFEAYAEISFSFIPGAWSTCSAACDGGTQTRDVGCAGSDGRKDYSVKRCESALGVAPPDLQQCNTHSCLQAQIAAMLARPIDNLYGTISVLLVPTLPFPVKCMARLSSFPPENVTVAMVREEGELSLPDCSPPQCEGFFLSLVPFSSFRVYCAVDDVNAEDDGIVARSEAIRTAASNVTSVSVVGTTETSTVLNVRLEAEMPGAQATITCFLHLNPSSLPPKGEEEGDMESSSGSVVREEVALASGEISDCDTRECEVEVKGLFAGGLYNSTCRSPAGKEVEGPQVRTLNAKIKEMHLLEVTGEPTVKFQVHLNADSWISCQATPTRLLRCCPNSPDLETARSLPPLLCNTPSCDVTMYAGVINDTRYALWCMSFPFETWSFSPSPPGDQGLRFSTPISPYAAALQGTTYFPTGEQEEVETRPRLRGDPNFIGAEEVQSSIELAVGLTLLGFVLLCVLAPPFRSVSNINPDVRLGRFTIAPPIVFLLVLEVSNLFTLCSQLLAIAYFASLSEWTPELKHFSLAVSVSGGVFLWQLLILGVFQYLFSKPRRSAAISVNRQLAYRNQDAGSIRHREDFDYSRLATLFIPPFSLAAAFEASYLELNRAWISKLVFLRIDAVCAQIACVVLLQPVTSLYGPSLFSALSYVGSSLKLVLALLSILQMRMCEPAPPPFQGLPVESAMTDVMGKVTTKKRKPQPSATWKR